MSKNFVVVYEALADFITATELADRVLVHEISWLEEDFLGSHRNWVGEEPHGGPLTWKSIPGRARSMGIKVHGKFDGDPGLPDANAARRAIAYVLSQFDDVDSVVLIRDMDDQRDRKRGLEQARALYSTQTTIVVGIASCERESWVICGFQPVDEAESKLLLVETQLLGWNPCVRSHDLTAGKDNSATKSPKRVLNVLTRSDRDRQRNCWRITPLKVLEERGTENGLASYLEEIRIHLVPKISGRVETQ